MRGLCHSFTKFCWVLLIILLGALMSCLLATQMEKNLVLLKTHNAFILGRGDWQLHPQESQCHLGTLPQMSIIGQVSCFPLMPHRY